MLNATTRSLKILSALFWCIGGVVLLLNGGGLLFEAYRLRPDQTWSWLPFVAGFFFGSVKARLLFSKFCQKNLTRIDALERPKVWQFFQPRFFVLLSLMITAGTTLSHLAHNNYPFLIGVAILDFSIAIALIGSSHIFWTHKVFGKPYNMRGQHRR